MRRYIFPVFLLLVVVFGLSFAVENAHGVRFNYYLGSIELPLSLLLVFAILVGALLGVVVSMLVVIRLRGEIRTLKRAEAMAKEELRNLRTIPIRDAP